MADTEQDERQAPEHAGGHGLSLTRKWHGVPIWGWTLGGTIAVVVVVRWWRNRSASSSSGSSSSDTGTSAQQCYDISGALVPCAEAAANNASGAGDLGGTLGGMYGAGDPGATGTGTDPGTGSGSDSGTPATGTTAPSSGRLTPPLGLHVASGGKTGVKVSWIAVPGATGYVALCKKGGNNGTPVNGPFNVAATQTYANFGGLKPGTAYTALIWPSSSTIEGGPGSNQPHSEYGFTTSK